MPEQRKSTGAPSPASRAEVDRHAVRGCSHTTESCKPRHVSLHASAPSSRTQSSSTTSHKTDSHLPHPPGLSNSFNIPRNTHHTVPYTSPRLPSFQQALRVLHNVAPAPPPTNDRLPACPLARRFGGWSKVSMRGKGLNVEMVGRRRPIKGEGGSQRVDQNGGEGGKSRIAKPKGGGRGVEE
ncbi:hypothetical protein BCR35DRAFT_38709 [Leucosporidium creatinivorum]|uniref:Uncharacterized protein n=1 Tax=Leucosporidium creatinivorum TaxID=106004 RepID=A0A1Y2FW91_9BASI|nr:hypothetical protein BCR35DRAFT_38709 [Leucosporidium creatinivorum]